MKSTLNGFVVKLQDSVVVPKPEQASEATDVVTGLSSAIT
jgi:hypothetical protein